MQDLVSIVIRTLNESKYINICLKAIEKQNYKNYEIIVVDSGSLMILFQNQNKKKYKSLCI